MTIKRQGGFYGRYHSWEAAQACAKGYDATHILDQVAEAAQHAMYDPQLIERDGVIIKTQDYSYPTLAYLSKWAMMKNQMTILDIGGSLGTSYFQFSKFFSNLNQIFWMIVEQQHFVQKGRILFSTPALSFYHSIEEALSERRTDTVLISAALQYFSSPYEWLKKINQAQAKYLIIDRLPVFGRDDDQITIQYVPKHIYEASYPAWIFSKTKLLSNLLTDYSLIHEFPAIDGHTYLGLQQIDFRGFILERKQ